MLHVEPDYPQNHFPAFPNQMFSAELLSVRLIHVASRNGYSAARVVQAKLVPGMLPNN
jgi:hypothetical protein